MRLPRVCPDEKLLHLANLVIGDDPVVHAFAGLAEDGREFSFRDYLASRTDDRTDPGIRDSHHRGVVLQRPHSRHGQQLIGRRCRAEPKASLLRRRIQQNLVGLDLGPRIVAVDSPGAGTPDYSRARSTPQVIAGAPAGGVRAAKVAVYVHA
jgi:hypothetical protein